MCDYECIEDNGSYAAVLKRLHLMSGRQPAVTEIRDRVDIEAGVAWLEFTVQGAKMHWDMAVDNDWLDCRILLQYDQLLSQYTNMRLYSNHTDYGQVAFIGCFTDAEFAVFNKLSKVRLLPTANQG